MQKASSRIIVSVLLVVALSVGFLPTLLHAENAVAASSSNYYGGITATQGTELLAQLHDLITRTHTHYTTYDECGSSSNKELVKLSDPGSNSNYLIEFYTQRDIAVNSFDVSGGWNREHVWPKANSNGLWKNNTTGGGADLHHVRPAEKDLNNARGNLKYGEVSNGTPQYASGTNALGGYANSTTFEPLDNVKGDVARILFYVYTHYNTYTNSIFGGYATTNGSGSSSYFGTLNFTHNVTASSEANAIAMLLRWNQLDPVDDIERTRNDYVATKTGNRNPFIDNANYANAIWGDGEIGIDSISLDKSSLTLSVGATATLFATASGAVTWHTDNAAVATVSAGTVCAVSAGTATITATCGTASATCTVTVTSGGGSPSVSAGSFTVDINSFTLGTGYDFFNWTSGGVGGFAYIFGTTTDKLQLNSSKSSYYLASNVATPGPIQSVTVKMKEGEKTWELRTSDTPFTQVATYPSTGTSHGTKTANASGVTWNVSGLDTYFTLNYTGSGVCYVESITVTYGSAQAPHECEHICGTCGKCLDDTCDDPVCADKCAGHVPPHVCTHICDTCNKCTDLTCDNSVCANKCPGHVPPHSCGHICDTCGKCTDLTCDNTVCADKCQGHVPPHTCGHICDTCNKCTDSTCADPVCADKCQGHVQPPVEHTCQHRCLICGLCTSNCTEDVCARKCNGHDPAPAHVCGHVCETCGKCTDKSCGNAACAEKCAGHDEPIIPQPSQAVQQFETAVEQIENQTSQQAILSAIEAALQIYAEMSDEDRAVAQLTPEYAQLEQQVRAYNAKVSAQNTENNLAVKTALSGFFGITVSVSSLALAAFVIKRKWL